MAIDTNQAISNAQTTLRNKAASSPKGEEELEKKDFMNLFLTQMSHQDPVDPMDSGAMMNQLAQLGTLEQLEKMNGQFTDLNDTQKDISRMNSLLLLDKDVMIESKSVEVNKGTGKPVFYSLDKEANDVKVTIEDRDGLPVYSESLGIMENGKHQFIWNGKNNEGYLMPDGEYNIRFSAMDKEGNSERLALFKAGKVGQVEYQDGETWIRMNNQKMPLSRVKNISSLSNKMFGQANPFPYVNELSPKGLVNTSTNNVTDENGLKKIDLSQ